MHQLLEYYTCCSFVPSTMQVHCHIFREFPQVRELEKNGIFRNTGHDYRKKE